MKRIHKDPDRVARQLTQHRSERAAYELKQERRIFRKVDRVLIGLERRVRAGGDASATVFISGRIGGDALHRIDRPWIEGTVREALQAKHRLVNQISSEVIESRYSSWHGALVPRVMVEFILA